MSDLNEEILSYLNLKNELDSIEYAEKHNLDHQKVVGSIKSLHSQSEGVNYIFIYMTTTIFIYF
jgi:hypothetical protein